MPDKYHYSKPQLSIICCFRPWHLYSSGFDTSKILGRLVTALDPVAEKLGGRIRSKMFCHLLLTHLQLLTRQYCANFPLPEVTTSIGRTGTTSGSWSLTRVGRLDLDTNRDASFLLTVRFSTAVCMFMLRKAISPLHVVALDHEPNSSFVGPQTWAGSHPRPWGNKLER